MQTRCLNLLPSASGALRFFSGRLRKLTPIFGKLPEAKQPVVR
ncbi:MAG TPA: hypothetical protein VGO57_05240 [Verrucomicrobiae bacterium]|jgi:hypothetical protein